MRTFEEIVAACKKILISGVFANGETFEDDPCVILPEWSDDEEAKYYDDLIEYWYDRDYWYCFDHNETIVGYYDMQGDYEITSYKEVE